MFPPRRILIPALIGGFAALTVASPRVAKGQEGPADSARAERPKIGLVLGGGGAKGGAHIGVLKVLEELRVPIDYIAGTSAGALIGGLYASGLEPLELERIVRRLDWQDLLTDRAPRESLTFVRRQDDRSVPSRFEVGFNKGGFRLPSGLITGQNVETTLRSLTLPVARVQSFEALPVPFRAVATDIATAEMVVIGEGDLATAMRASMSIPGAFAPVEVDGRLLVDGAVVRNLPVDVVKEMGADVVIAVDLSSPLRPREQINNVADVSSQATRIATLANTTPQRALLRDGSDILLIPDVEHIQLAAFRNLPEAILPGEESARKSAEVLGALSVSEREYLDYLAERRRYSPAPIPIEFIRVDGSVRLSESVIRARLDLAVGDSLSENELESSLARVYGLGLFERVDYAVVTEVDRTGVVVRVVEKPWGPGFTRVGLALGNDLERGTSGFTILANHTQAAINSLGGEVRAELRIGEGQALSAELLQPLDAGGRFFASVGWAYREELLDVAVSGAGDVSRDVDERVAHIAVGVHPADWSELRIEARRGAVDRKGTLLEAAPEVQDPDIGALLGRWTVDRLDDRAFPRSGLSGVVEVFRSSDGLGGDPAYTRLEASVSAAVSRGDHTLLVSGHVGTSYDDPLPRHHDFALGGFRRLSGLRAREVTGNHLLFAGLGLQRRLAVLQSGLVGGNLYAGLSLEAGNVWSERGDASLDDMRASVGVYVGLETILGPLYLSLAGADGGDNAFFLFLGKAF